MKSFSLLASTVLFGVLLGIGYVLSTAHIAHAQVPSSARSLDPLTVVLNPSTPSPNRLVTIEIKSFLTDLTGAEFTWYEDGKVVNKGTGITSHQLYAPNSGQRITVAADVKTIEGRTSRKTVVIAPGEVDITWYTEGVVPPFYKGKSLFSHQSTVHFVAMPNLRDAKGNKLDPKSLVYVWKKDSKVLGQQSGFGKQVLSTEGALISRPFVISVDVASKDGTIRGESFLEIESRSPELVFYEEDPLYGVLYNKAVGNRFDLQHNEVTFIPVPYYFPQSSTQGVGSLSYLWNIAGNEREDLATKRKVTLRANPESEGSARISLEVRGLNDILQQARTEFTAFYSKIDSNVTPGF